MTEFLNVEGGTIAYQVAGSRPLMVLVHGIGQSRDAYRFMAPELVAAGYRGRHGGLAGQRRVERDLAVLHAH